MKTIIILAGLLFGSNILKADDKVIKDPLLDYYQAIQTGDTLGDAEPHCSPQTKIYYFEADFTGDKRKSIFITDDESRQGPHGLYGWFVYYPLSSGGYQKVADGMSMYKSGPDYIGYVDQIKRYGIIMGGKDSVGVCYLADGAIQSKAIDMERGHANPETYPKYFHAHFPDYHIATYTLAQLTKKYANPDPNNVITPASKLSEELGSAAKNDKSESGWGGVQSFPRLSPLGGNVRAIVEFRARAFFKRLQRPSFESFPAMEFPQSIERSRIFPFWRIIGGMTLAHEMRTGEVRMRQFRFAKIGAALFHSARSNQIRLNQAKSNQIKPR